MTYYIRQTIDITPILLQLEQKNHGQQARSLTTFGYLDILGQCLSSSAKCSSHSQLFGDKYDPRRH